MKVIVGDNQMLNTYLARRLRDEVVWAPCQDLAGFTQRQGELRDAEVFFTGCRPWGSIAVRDNPADICLSASAVLLDVIAACHRMKVKKMVWVASSCMYPASQWPLQEADLDPGMRSLDPASEPAALPRVLAMRLCGFYRKQYGDNFVTAIPATIYGPGDDFSPEGHALPFFMQTFHEAKAKGTSFINFRGSGSVRREWIYVEDAANALAFIMDHFNEPYPINIGVGNDTTMDHLVAAIQGVVGTCISTSWDGSGGGVDRKLLSSAILHKLGWDAKIPLNQGLEMTYEWYVKAVRAAGEPEQPA